MLGGLVIGAVSVAVSFLKLLPFAYADTIFSLAELVAIVFCLYKLGRWRAMLGDPAQGYSFGQNMGFVMAVMLVAGFISGVGEYFQADFFNSRIMNNASDDVTANQIVSMLIEDPFSRAFYGMLWQIIYGCIIGLFVTPFVTRRPEPQNTQHDEQQT